MKCKREENPCTFMKHNGLHMLSKTINTHWLVVLDSMQLKVI